jgi:hypothetical protein
MYLIVYKGKDAQALQRDNSAEIPNTYKIQPFRGQKLAGRLQLTAGSHFN